jgi:hypothetical protein
MVWNFAASAASALAATTALSSCSAGGADGSDQGQTRELSWQQAVSHLESCNVEMAVQKHELDVYRDLRDGSRVHAKEPAIDEVFRVLNRTRRKCGTIPIATE